MGRGSVAELVWHRRRGWAWVQPGFQQQVKVLMVKVLMVWGPLEWMPSALVASWQPQRLRLLPQLALAPRVLQV